MAGLSFADSVVNKLSGKKYNVSTARKFPLRVWETAVIKSGFLAGFSTKNFLFVEETIEGGGGPDQLVYLVSEAHKQACEMATTQPEDYWRMTFDEIREKQKVVADLFSR